MKRLPAMLLMASGALMLGGCATLPNGPSIMALPGRGKTFEQFQEDNAYCRQYARAQVGGQSAQQNADATTLKSAGVGALLGGALGAASGDSQSAGVGAATGALLGTAVGSSNAAYAAGSLQHQYDNAYGQCMYAKGNAIPVAGRLRSRRRQQVYYPPPPPGEDD